MSTAKLNGVPCSAARVQVGDWGAWWADLTLTEPEAFAKGATAAIVFAGVSMLGTVVSGGAADGRAAYRVCGGFGGWGREIPAQAYNDDRGVKAATVISDAARAAGERVDDLPSTRLGPHYARAKGAASAALNEIAPRGWRVDFDGATRFGKRPTTTYTGSGSLSRRDTAAGIFELATEDLTGLVPGVSIEGSAPATDVEYLIEGDRLTVRVWALAGASRRLSAIERMVLALFPNLRYRGAFEFRVVTQSGERLDLQPVRSASGMPLLSRVPVRPGMAGLKAIVLPGSLVVVQFLDADPSRPIVTNHDAPDAPGWMPLSLELGGPLALGVARMTDPVQAGPFSGVIVSGSLRVKAAL